MENQRGRDRESAGSGAYDLNIYVHVSSNEGDSWTKRRVDTDTAARIQFHPRVAVDQASGNVAILWYDCRADSQNKRTHPYLAVSRDGFATSARNFRLSGSQSLAEAIPQWGVGYKEYIGLGFLGGYVYPVWIDNSNSTSDNPEPDTNGDGFAQSFDVYTARMPF